MSCLELTKDEKYKIYIEEKERLLKEEQLIEKKKLDTLTDASRFRIYNEMESKNTINVKEQDLQFPDKKKKRNFEILAGVVGVSFFINVIFGFLLLMAFAIYYGFQFFKGGINFEPMISFRCPKCDHKHRNFIRKAEEQEQKIFGGIQATCLSCKHTFRLVVEENVLSKLKI